MGKTGRILVWLAVWLIWGSLSNPVQAKTIEVWQDGPVPSIQAALAQAAHGDTIQVYAGIYNEQLVVDKTVKLIGMAMPTIDGGGFGDVLTITADGVTIKGFEISRSGKMLETADAGIKIKSHNNIIEDSRITNNLFGIYLEKSTGNVIRRNLIKGRPVIRDTGKATVDESSARSSYDIKFEGDGGDGIHLYASPDNLIENNVITDTRDGIYFDFSERSKVLNNHIYGVRYGIHYMYSEDNYFEGNILTDNVAGTAPMFSKYIVFRHNVLAGSRGHRAYGILFAHCDYCLMEDNIVIDNTRGIFLDHSLHNVIRNNLIAMNDIGLDFISSSTDNIFEGNSFVDNMQQVVLIAGRVGRGNMFYSEDERGNYWSDYRGFDLDRDGIGDIPHLTGDVFTYLMAKAPAVRLFLNSPAAKALEFSERMFPIINIPKVVDDFPLVEPVELEMPEFVLSGGATSNKIFGFYSFIMLILGLVIFGRGLLLGRGGRGFFISVVKRGE